MLLTQVSKSETGYNKAWDDFFSSLACSEMAAYHECIKISHLLKTKSEDKLAQKYIELSEEEKKHYFLAQKMVISYSEPTKKAKEIYSGEHLGIMNDPLTEKMMVIHLVFETAAMIILGFLNKNAKSLFDLERAKTIEECTAEILKDEVLHVSDGRKIFNELVSNNIIEKPTKNDLIVLKKHMYFLKLGLKYFFKNIPELKPIVEKINTRYENTLNRIGLDYGIQI